MFLRGQNSAIRFQSKSYTEWEIASRLALLARIILPSESCELTSTTVFARHELPNLLNSNSRLRVYPVGSLFYTPFSVRLQGEQQTHASHIKLLSTSKEIGSLPPWESRLKQPH